MTNFLQSAIALHQAGMMAEAENAYRLVLRAEPNNADALGLLGSVLSERKSHDEAILTIERAIAIDPQAALFYFYLGNACEKAGRFVQSEAAFLRATALAPQWAEAFYNLGNVQRVLKKTAEAKETYLKTLQLNPNHILCHNNLAHVYSTLMDYPSARKQLETGMAIAPDNTQLLFTLHDIAHEHNDFLGAFNAAHQVARVKLGAPKDTDMIEYLKSMPQINTKDEQIRNCLFALGASYFLNVDLEKASYVLRLLFSLEPDLAEVPTILGSVALSRNKPDLADAYYSQAFMLNPAETCAPWNRSMDLLVSGNLSEGFRRYRWRWSAMEKFKAMRLKADMWDGSDPTGKTIVVQEEQGFGDALQMLRFVPILKERGANVWAYVRPELYAILEHWDGASKVVKWKVEDKTVPPEVDYACGLMDLPGNLGIGLENIPRDVPYIPNPKKGLPQFKLNGQGMKIGLVWSGNPQHKRNFARSFPFQMWKPLFELTGTTFYSLQYKPKQEDVDAMQACGVINVAPNIKDLADAAATIAELDLLLSVDSAPAHLAGALGVPVWTLLTIDPDWRWLLGRDDSPWYPSMRLFRQPKQGDWAGVMLNVKAALGDFIAKNGAK